MGNKEKALFYALDVKKRRKDQRIIFHTLSGLLYWPFSVVLDGMSTKHTSLLTKKKRKKKPKVTWVQQLWLEAVTNSQTLHHGMSHGKIMPNHSRPRDHHHHPAKLIPVL